MSNRVYLRGVSTKCISFASSYSYLGKTDGQSNFKGSDCTLRLTIDIEVVQTLGEKQLGKFNSKNCEGICEEMVD